MKNTMAVTGQIVGGPQLANVNSTARLVQWIEVELNDLMGMTDVKMSQKKFAVIGAKIAVYTRILTFLENDSARRIDA